MDSELKSQLKEMMVTELTLQVPAAGIGDDTAIFGPDGLGLDSVDALQLVVALEKLHGLKVKEGAEARETLRSVNTIVEAIKALK